MGAVIVAAWLVEAKQSVVENMAPVLTKVFTPLATLMLAVYLVAILSTGDLVEADRELLILADLILVLVLGLLLYAISARDPHTPPGPFDRLQLVLVLIALAIDVLMLATMLGRIAEFGASPNKVAALGLNLVLLANLSWSARLLAGSWRGRPPSGLERWQTSYLPVFPTWAAVVVVVLPPAFGWM
jgi:small-conductance mechanosensitive channel